MFDKQVTVHLKPTDVEVLNNDELIKTAAFVLPDDTKYDPDFLYLLVRAVSAGEYYDDNKNGDFFPEAELEQFYTTFLKAHVFKNHENKDVQNSIGDVLKTTWLDKMKQVELLIRIDRRIAPSIVRGISKGYITDVSMGCRVAYSVCSICGNKAKTPREYCDHIKFMRRQILPDGRKVYEINIRPIFHDISIVLNGAEKVAKIEGVHQDAEKTAEQSVTMFEKVASYHMPETPKKINDFSDVINNSREILASYKDMMDDSSKNRYYEKVAEIEKRIEGDILNGSLSDVAKERENKAQKVRGILSALQGTSLNETKISDICGKLAKISEENGKTIYQTFNEFLKVLDFAGIELSPYEMSLFTKKLIPGMQSMQIPNMPSSLLPNIITDSVRTDNICDTANCDSLNVPKTMMAIRMLIKKPIDSISSIPGLKKKIVIIAKNTPDVFENNELQNSIASRVIDNDILSSKSMCPKFIIKRVENINSSGSYQNPFASFVRPKTISDLLSRIIYESYQNDRMERLASGETFKGFEKFASLTTDCGADMARSFGLEKTAARYEKWRYLPDNETNRGIGPSPYYNFVTASMLGTPIISFLSKYQRAKIANGREVSNFGRMLADSPADVQQFQAIFGPTFYNYLRAKAIKTGTGITSGIAGIWNGSYSKYGPTPAMLKTASEHIEKAGIDKQKQNAIMLALNFKQQKRDDLADEILKKFKISEKELKKYLQMKKKCYTISLNDKIEKCASAETNQKFLLPSGMEDIAGYAALVDFISNNTVNIV